MVDAHLSTDVYWVMFVFTWLTVSYVKPQKEFPGVRISLFYHCSMMALLPGDLKTRKRTGTSCSNKNTFFD